MGEERGKEREKRKIFKKNRLSDVSDYLQSFIESEKFEARLR